jgi:hypothetical protein
MPPQGCTYSHLQQEAPESVERAQVPGRIEEPSRYLFKVLNILDRIGPDEQQNLYQKMDLVLKNCMIAIACFMPSALPDSRRGSFLGKRQMDAG